MATFKELQDQIAKLKQDAEEVRLKEIDGAIAQIKSLMNDYGITVQDIESSGRRKGSKATSLSNVQFKDDSGNTWSGRGRMPAWLKGKDKEKFRVNWFRAKRSSFIMEITIFPDTAHYLVTLDFSVE